MSVPSTRQRVRAWIQRLGTKGHLAFSGQDELKMLLDLYDDRNPSHPIQYYFDDRFKGNLPVPDFNLCHTASEHLDRNRTKENYPTDEGLLRTSDGHFINASTIEGKDRIYIATQHPLPSTVLDFWKMVLAEKPTAVIMLNKYDYDQSYKKPDEPELVQYWPGTSKSGPFVDSILLEDKETGGTVKVSVLPEPPDHDIEELEKEASPKFPGPNLHKQDSSATSQDMQHITAPNGTSTLTNPSSLTLSTNYTAPVILTNPTISTNLTIPTNPTILTLPAAPPENSTQQIALLNPATNTIVQQITPNTTDVAPPVKTVTETSAKSGKDGKTEKKELKGIHGHQEYKYNNNIEYSRLLVEYNGQQHQLWHIRCGGWKDQDAPDLDLFMDLWRLVQEKLKSHDVNSGEKHKIVIHCTGGVGRTGTFIAVDIAGQELKEKQKDGKWDEFSIEKVIAFLRKKRMNMVGSVSQYIFCHRAALSIFGAGAEEWRKSHQGVLEDSSSHPVGALT